MKRGVLTSLVFILLVSILVSIIAFAAEDEGQFSIRFHSFGKNATVDLKNYLGESRQYLVSETENVIVILDQARGIAYIEANPGWEGTETIFFRTVESKALPPKPYVEPEDVEFKIPEIFIPEDIETKVIKYQDNPLQLLEGIIESSMIELIRSIPKEEVRKISKSVTGKRLDLGINDEVNISIDLSYNPVITMAFSLEPEQKEGYSLEDFTDPDKISLGLKIFLNFLALMVVISAIYVYLRRKHQIKLKNL